MPSQMAQLRKGGIAFLAVKSLDRICVCFLTEFRQVVLIRLGRTHSHLVDMEPV
jgi:hypothetical protein